MERRMNTQGGNQLPKEVEGELSGSADPRGGLADGWVLQWLSLTEANEFGDFEGGESGGGRD